MATDKEQRTAFTVCPVLRGWLRGNGQTINIIYGTLDRGLKVTVASDDPTYMKGNYVAASLVVAKESAGLSRQDFLTLARDSFDVARIIVVSIMRPMLTS